MLAPRNTSPPPRSHSKLANHFTAESIRTSRRLSASRVVTRFTEEDQPKKSEPPRLEEALDTPVLADQLLLAQLQVLAQATAPALGQVTRQLRHQSLVRLAKSFFTSCSSRIRKEAECLKPIKLLVRKVKATCTTRGTRLTIIQSE